MATFDLVLQPWILVMDGNGKAHQAGLKELLLKAHTLREIRDPLPTVEFGLYRLLTALVMDAFGLSHSAQLENLLEKGHFDAAKVETYFEAYGDRFDLFDATHPFLQTAEMTSEADKPLAGLLHPVPSGTNALHFHHALEKNFAVSPAAAARLLCTIAPFMTAGGAGLSPSVNGAPPWYVLINGQTLFETICLNCCTFPLPQGNDGVPAWRAKGRLEAGKRNAAKLLEGLTWQPRRILLVAGGPGQCSLTCAQSDTLVSAMKFGPGSACDADAGFLWTDPAVPYKIDDKGPRVQRPQEGKEVWRDIGPLALLTHNSHGGGDKKIHFARPTLIDQFLSLVQKNGLLEYRPLDLTLYGMRTDLKMKILEWQREALSLPVRLVLNRKFHQVAQSEIEKANAVDYALRQAIKKAYPRGGKGNNNAFDALIAHTRSRFWASLKQGYLDLLHEIAPLSPEDDQGRIDDQISTWHASLKRTGVAMLEEAINGMDSNAREIVRVQVEVRGTFHKAMQHLFERPQPVSTTGGKEQQADTTSGGSSDLRGGKPIVETSPRRKATAKQSDNRTGAPDL